MSSLAERVEGLIANWPHQAELVRPAQGLVETDDGVVFDAGYHVCSIDCRRCQIEKLLAAALVTEGQGDEAVLRRALLDIIDACDSHSGADKLTIFNIANRALKAAAPSLHKEEPPQLDNWIAEFSLTDESDVLDEFTLDEQAKIWGLMRTAWNTARERTLAALHKEGAGGVSPKALKAALDEIEDNECVCGAARAHRTMHNWAYCSLHARLDKVWKLFVDAQDAAASPAGRAEQVSGSTGAAKDADAR